jgi:hypothetical protein
MVKSRQYESDSIFERFHNCIMKKTDNVQVTIVSKMGESFCG